MINFIYVITAIIFGLLITYLLATRYVIDLRKDSETSKDLPVILTSILLGGPSLILSYLIFSEIRIEDGVRHHRYLISSIVITILQILLIVLLSVFNVISYSNS